ncbi:MAG: hypothetical protein E7015_02325 [Alphaproteobacteria bacterium]|nr:hypothetical protein [Alphaproteobacteria bacterium]
MDKKNSDLQQLTGCVLLATPSITTEYLNKSMVYICEHSEDGAMGVVINKLIPDANILNIIKKWKINNSNHADDLHIHFGGMEEIDKCFILYSDDYTSSNNQIIKDHIALAISDDIIKSVITSEGPTRKIICMGCCTWEAGQLENEIASNYWIPIPADEALIFGDPCTDKWSKAFLKIGLQSKLFIHKAGNA